MHANEGLLTAAYVVAAVLFILALGGLSNQEKAKRAIWYGIIGMTLAVAATVSAAGGQTVLISMMVIFGGFVACLCPIRVIRPRCPNVSRALTSGIYP